MVPDGTPPADVKNLSHLSRERIDQMLERIAESTVMLFNAIATDDALKSERRGDILVACLQTAKEVVFASLSLPGGGCG